MARREVILLTAKEWQKKLAAHERMQANERREFDEKYRYELTVSDHRDQAIGLIHSRLGAGEAGFERAAARGGCSAWTYKTWADPTKNIQPRAQSFRKTAIALGIKYGFHE